MNVRSYARPIAFVLVALAIVAGTQLEWSSQHTSAPPHARPADSRRQAIPSSSSTTTSTTTTTIPAPPPEEPMPTQTEAPLEPIAAPAPVPTVGPGSGECANPIVPEAVARRESGCRWDAYNPDGCAVDGVVYACTGFFQISGGHYLDPSPWGGRGVCVGLDKWAIPDQIECASRLGPGAWN